MRVLGLFVVFVVMLGPSTSMTTERPELFLETPMFEAAVAAGKLPPVKKRLPEEPFLLKTGQQGFQPGKHGGSLKLLMGRKKDTRQLVVYGYARLVGYDKNFNFVPDILKKFEVKHGRIFTLHLRKGHRWSDGHPFTSEDFRYYFEDVATNKKIANESLPQVMLVEGKPPLFEVLDKHTIRYTWHKANPFILPRLAGARPIYLYRPAHYLKKFHIKYTPLRTLEVLAKKAKKVFFT